MAAKLAEAEGGALLVRMARAVCPARLACLVLLVFPGISRLCCCARHVLPACATRAARILAALASEKKRAASELARTKRELEAQVCIGECYSRAKLHEE